MNPSKSQVYEERYLTHAQIQDALDECAEKGEPSSVLFVMRELFNKGYGTAVRPVVSGASTFEETIALTPLLESMMKKMFVPKPRRKNVRDSLLIPETSVCFCSRLFNHNFIPINAHDCFDVYYVWHGKCMIEFEDSSFMLEEGMVGIISPGSSYRADPTDHSDVFHLSIRTSTFENTFFSYLTTQNLLSDFFREALFQKKPHPNYLIFTRKSRATVQIIIEELYRETNFPSEWSEESNFHYLCLLFMNLLRDFSFDECFSPVLEPEEETTSFLLSYIQENYDKYSLQQMADSLHYNPNYLSGLIREKTGMNYTQLVRSFRMIEAKKMLLATKDPIESIARQVGYTSPDTFTKVFKKETGMTPTHYRRLNQNF